MRLLKVNSWDLNGPQDEGAQKGPCGVDMGFYVVSMLVSPTSYLVCFLPLYMKNSTGHDIGGT